MWFAPDGVEDRLVGIGQPILIMSLQRPRPYGGVGVIKPQALPSMKSAALIRGLLDRVACRLPAKGG